MSIPHHAKEVAVLILAHKGVANPKIWLQWAESDKTRYPVYLYALCESKSQDCVCTRHGLQTVRILPSRWCGKNIAVNTLNALKQICKQKKNLAIIYLVSGHCLPLQPPSYLYSESITLPTTHVDNGKKWHPLQTSMTVLKHHKGNIVECTQWIALEPETINQLHHDKQLLNSSVVRKQCPDEWYIQTLVHRAGIPYQNIAYMDFCHRTHSSRSPVLWDLHSKERKRIEWTYTSYRYVNAEAVFKFSQKAGYAFARKFQTTTDSDHYFRIVYNRGTSMV